MFIVLLAMVFMVGFGGVAMSADISNSKHDFSTSGSGQGQSENSSGEVCNTCHAPHSPSDAAKGPLWDHAVTAVTNFDVYGDPNGTINATLGQPGTSSLLCLSCHDGTVAIDSFGGATGTAFLDSSDSTWVGSDLSDDHPIGFTWDDSLTDNDGELQAVGGSNDLPLFDSKMECATCHNAHDGAATNFLRADNAGSALCTSCHIK